MNIFPREKKTLIKYKMSDRWTYVPDIVLWDLPLQQCVKSIQN